MRKLLTISLALSAFALLGASLLYGENVTAATCWAGTGGPTATSPILGTYCPPSSCDPTICTTNCGPTGAVSSCSPTGGVCLLVCTY
jgi:hypothetical protein